MELGTVRLATNVCSWNLTQSKRLSESSNWNDVLKNCEFIRWARTKQWGLFKFLLSIWKWRVSKDLGDLIPVWKWQTLMLRRSRDIDFWSCRAVVPWRGIGYNGLNSWVWEFFNVCTKKFVLKSYWEIHEGKVRSALVKEKWSVRALCKAHKITLKR